MYVYFPCNDRQYERFCNMFDSVLADINLNTQVIVGSDINARIGTWTSDKHKQVLRPYGIARSNTCGENLCPHLWRQRYASREHLFQSHTRGLCHLHQYSHKLSPCRHLKHAWHLPVLAIPSQANTWLQSGSPRSCQWPQSSLTQPYAHVN